MNGKRGPAKDLMFRIHVLSLGTEASGGCPLHLLSRGRKNVIVVKRPVCGLRSVRGVHLLPSIEEKIFVTGDDPPIKKDVSGLLVQPHTQ